MRRAGQNALGSPVADAPDMVVTKCSTHSGVATFDEIGNGDTYRFSCADGTRCYQGTNTDVACSDQCPSGVSVWSDDAGECILLAGLGGGGGASACTTHEIWDGTSCVFIDVGSAFKLAQAEVQCNAMPHRHWNSATLLCDMTAVEPAPQPNGPAIDLTSGGIDLTDLTGGIVAKLKAKCLADGKNIYNDKTGACTPKGQAGGKDETPPSDNTALYVVGGLTGAALLYWLATRKTASKGKRR